MLTNPVLVSVVVMVVLSLVKVNVLIAIILAALTGGIMSGMGISETMKVLIGGMGGNAETALSYILLGALAYAIGKTGAAEILAIKIGKVIKDRRTIFVLLIAGIASLSQNLIPVHIAFIPILIPPLLGVMNKLKIDRRAVATALTFGLKAPYVMLPVGFGLIFHTTISEALADNGLDVLKTDVWKSMLLPGLGMVIGLLIAVFITYRKPRQYEEEGIVAEDRKEEDLKLNKSHVGALLGALVAFVIQVSFGAMDIGFGSLPIGAIVGLIIMILFGAFKWDDMDEIVYGGIGVMGFIAFVMLVASGFGEVIRATGGVDELVEASVSIMGGSKVISAFVMLLIGLVITMGIGTSFGTVPILAAVFVPLALELGFSVPAIVALVGTAGALGDAGSPASDSTLGPTAGLSIDGQHDHIWDTVVPTFIHFNIPLIIMGTVAALIL